MKKCIRLLMIFACIGAIVLSLSSCKIEIIWPGETKNDTDNSTSESTPETITTSVRCNRISDLNTYVVHPSNNANVVVDKFCDGIYNYFYFKLGEIHDVPIYYSNYQKHNAEVHTLSIYSEQSVSQLLQKTTDICISNGIEDTLEESSSITSAIGTSEDSMAMISASEGIATSQTTSFNSSIGMSFTESITNSISNGTQNEFSLTEADAAGYYRFIKLADFDVYAVLVCNIEKRTCYYEYLTSVQTDSIEEGWFYGESSDEMKDFTNLNNAQKKLSFDSAVFSDMDLYTAVEETRLIRKISAHSDQDYYVSYWKSTNQKIWCDASIMYNSDAPSKCNLKNVKITVTTTVESTDGKAKCVVKLYSGKETLLDYSKNISGEKTFTISKTISYEQFLSTFSTDKNVYVSYQADKSSAFDFADNHYHIRDMQMIIEFVE